MADDQYRLSPRLLSVVTQVPLERLPTRLTPSMFPGQQGRVVMRHRQVFKSAQPLVRLVCQVCGRRADYPLYPIAFQREFLENGSSLSDDRIQVMAYIRCKGCNAADQLEFPDGTMPLLLRARLIGAARLPVDSDPENSPITYGIFEMFDGTRPATAKDAEDHLLDLIEAGSGDAAFLWDRLGNIYERGGRQDLAAVAFEQAIRIDPRQLESLYSLGLVLVEVGAVREGAHLLRRAFACAAGYRRLRPETRRWIVVEALSRLDQFQAPFWPTADEVRMSGDGIERGAPPAVDLSTSTGLEQAADWILVKRPVPPRKMGRNDPCPCGSGRKYKRCCGT